LAVSESFSLDIAAASLHSSHDILKRGRQVRVDCISRTGFSENPSSGSRPGDCESITDMRALPAVVLLASAWLYPAGALSQPAAAPWSPPARTVGDANRQSQEAQERKMRRWEKEAKQSLRLLCEECTGARPGRVRRPSELELPDGLGDDVPEPQLEREP